MAPGDLRQKRNQEQTTRNVNSNETTVESNLVSPSSATQSPEVPNHETSEIPSTEDDVAARTTAGSKKRTRGLTMGKGILKYFDTKKTKIKIDVNESVGRPLDADQSAKLSSQIGVVTRDVLPVPKKWKEVDENHGLEPGFDHLKNVMDVNIDDHGVRQCLINRIKISTRNQRHKLHLHFQKYATVQEAKNNKPSFGPNKEQWEELCDYFASDKFKVDEATISKKNLHMGRILIKTPLSDIPRDPFPVMVDGTEFFIRIREEAECDEDDYTDWSDGEILVFDEDNCDWW
ncbi:hypothetical protein ACS0TY_017358 [Phlomoides rotata]